MTEVVFYFILFLSLYIQIFYLVTFLEKRGEIKETKKSKEPPGLSIIVPCFNEEKNVAKTINSLLAADYPKEKMEILVVDDGSTDGTFSVIKQFASDRVKVFHKGNGGKASALNFGLTYAQNEIVGCVDADSAVAPDALLKMVSLFEDKEVMAVGSSVIVAEPKNLIELAQAAEYHMAVYVKKVLGWLSGLHVVAGALSLFRREVFDKIGNFRDAHKTEDMEIIFRMQINKMKVAQCHDAFVYTVAPKTVGALYKQRRRWIYGFLNNTIDYRKYLLRPQFGNFAILTVPSGLIGIGGVIYLFGAQVTHLFRYLFDKILQLQTIGFVSFKFNFDPFFLSTKPLVFLVILTFAFVIFTTILGKKMAKEKISFLDIASFLGVSTFVAPFWLISAIRNTLFRRKINWR